MGLITSILSKMTNSKRMKFEEFDKNYFSNCKIFAKQKDEILKEVVKITKFFEPDSEIIKNIDNEYDNIEIYFNDVLMSENYLNCKGSKNETDYKERVELFATAISELVTYQKLYVLYYIYFGEVSRTEGQLNGVANRLAQIYDMIVFITVDYFVYGRKDAIYYLDGVFSCDKQSSAFKLFEKMKWLLETNKTLIDAIRTENSATVFQISNELGKTNIFAEEEEIFEL